MEISIKNNQYIQYFIGKIKENNIEFIFEKNNHNFNQKIIEFIEYNWKENLLKNPNIYNGKLYNILKIENKNNKIQIIYDIVDYKTSIATKNKEYKKFNNNYFSNHLTITAILKTSDNRILIGSDLTFKNNLQSWKFPGGFFDAEKDKTIIDCLKRECAEEIGKYNFLNIDIINISKNVKHNFTTIICLADVKKSSEEILKYNTENKDKIIDNNEMQIIKFIDFNKEEINKILNCELISLSPTTMTGLTSLLSF